MQAINDSSSQEATRDDRDALSGFRFDLPSTPCKAAFGKMPFRNQVQPSNPQKTPETLSPVRNPSPGPFELPANSTTPPPTGSETSTDGSTRDGHTTTASGDSTSLTSWSSIPPSEERHGTQASARTRDRFPRNETAPTLSSEAEHSLDSSGSAAAHSAKTSLQRIFSDSGTGRVGRKALLDILSRETFLDALQNPPVRHRLHSFAQTTSCSEHMSFLDQVSYYRKTMNESTNVVGEIDSQYLAPGSPSHIDMSSPIHENLRANIATIVEETSVSVDAIFGGVEQAVQNAVFEHMYEDFVRTQLILSASEALSNDRHQYQGLGDCFCLTEPSKADNPIMFASDGFIAVTGYEREEVIPRNCRFLQGEQTDNVAARRIGLSVRNKQESIEFLLNYRKNGEPFWNLLYTAPLIDSTGRVAFYIGGQINCSSSVHDKPDIMRVLATSPDHEREAAKLEEDERRNTPVKALVRRAEQIKTLKYRQKAEVEEEPGVERRLLENNQALNSSSRIKRVFSAYSKYLVARYPTVDIEFVSDGVGDVLQQDDQMPVIGVDIFKFLKRNMPPREKSDWRYRIQAALKRGRPISVSLNLRTKRAAVFHGDEKYLTHWTPLKDLGGKVQWVVVCLCPTLQQ